MVIMCEVEDCVYRIDGSCSKDSISISVKTFSSFVGGEREWSPICEDYKEVDKICQIENQMVVDEAWDWNESMLPERARLKRERQAYEEAERENRNEWYSSSNYAGECEDYLEF